MKIALGIAITVAFAGLYAQPPQGPQPEAVKQGQALVRQGKLEDALALYKQELAKQPGSMALNNAAGVVLDLLGRTKEARTHFAKAIREAPTAQAKAAAERAMAMSYAFDNNCAGALKAQQPVIDYWVAEKNFFQAGEMANEAARVCIEAGDFNTAEKWYRKGTELGLKEPGISADRIALWNFRLEHAEARLAARRGNKAGALKHVAAAKALLDSHPGMARQQAIFFPYLTGYVALYTGDAAGALTDLAKANQNDPFIQCLMGMADEKLGHKEQAMEYYRKAAQATGHNPTTAFAVPFVRKKLAGR
ncbi:MAG: tetratricopeptide repeat protein [Bryobacterales bacterium]|nr:tetratricopeptide repeat protein [Bryobacterales bacterium]